MVMCYYGLQCQYTILVYVGHRVILLYDVGAISNQLEINTSQYFVYSLKLYNYVNILINTRMHELLGSGYRFMCIVYQR